MKISHSFFNVIFICSIYTKEKCVSSLVVVGNKKSYNKIFLSNFTFIEEGTLSDYFQVVQFPVDFSRQFPAVVLAVRIERFEVHRKYDVVTELKKFRKTLMFNHYVVTKLKKIIKTFNVQSICHHWTEKISKNFNTKHKKCFNKIVWI